MPQFQELREVYAQEHARPILMLLAESPRPVPYSIVRRKLDIHPQKFQRALERLERLALVGRILEAPKAGTPNAYTVFLEPTATGRHITKLWHEMEDGARQDEALRSFFPKDSPTATPG